MNSNKMKITSVRRIALAVLLSVALMLGFVQAAEAQQKATLPLQVTVQNAKTGTRTLPIEGGVLRVNVQYQGLTVGKDYHLDIGVMDLNAARGPESINVGATVPLKPQNANGSEAAELEVKDSSLNGHTLLVVAFVFEGQDSIVAEGATQTNVNQQIQYGVKDAEEPQADAPAPAPAPNQPGESPSEPKKPEVPKQDNQQPENKKPEKNQNNGKDEQKPQSDASSSNGSSNWGWAIAAVVGLVGVIGAGIAFVLSKLGKAFKLGR